MLAELLSLFQWLVRVEVALRRDRGQDVAATVLLDERHHGHPQIHSEVSVFPPLSSWETHKTPFSYLKTHAST